MFPTLWRSLATFDEESYWTPAIDVVDSINDVKVLAEIPGLKKEDILVSVEGDVLILKGEKKSNANTNANGVLRSERIHGIFFRALTLPKTVDTSKITAAYNNGVLELTLPKIAESKPKQIPISVN